MEKFNEVKIENTRVLSWLSVSFCNIKGKVDWD